jgi:hypothetical protein
MHKGGHTRRTAEVFGIGRFAAPKFGWWKSTTWELRLVGMRTLASESATHTGVAFLGSHQMAEIEPPIGAFGPLRIRSENACLRPVLSTLSLEA